MNPLKIPFHPKQFKGESLTSYLQRLSKANMLTAHELWRFYLIEGKHYPQTMYSSTLNIVPEGSVDVSRLSKSLGLEVHQLLDMTFRATIIKLGAEASPTRALSGLIEKRLKFCPCCLEEELFYKLIWQVKEVTTCPIHKLKLLKNCQQCKNLIPLLAVNSEIGLCPTCGASLISSSVTKTTEDILLQQERIIEDWEHLLNPKSSLVPCIPNTDAKQALATALIYVANGLEPECIKENIQENELVKKVPALLQSVRGTRVRETTTHLSILLFILRAKGMSCDDFSKLVVPREFLESILSRPVLLRDSYSCKTPWCNHLGKAGSLQRTGTSKKITKNGNHLNYYMYCTQCLVEYAVDANSKSLIERGYFISLAWGKVRPLLLQGKGIRETASTLGESNERVLRSIMYLVANNLVPMSIIEKYVPEKVDFGAVDKITVAINDGTNINRLFKNSKWSYREFLYYRFNPEVQRVKLECKKPRPKSKGNPFVRQEKVTRALENLIAKNEKITINKVCKLTGVNHETLRLWGALPLIKRYKYNQTNEEIRNLKEEWISKVDQVLLDLNNENLPIKSEAVYGRLGVRRNVLVRNFPEGTAYVTARLMQNRQLEQQERLNEYIRVANEAVERKIQNGSPCSQADFAAEVGLSLSGFQRYPELSDVWRQCPYQ